MKKNKAFQPLLSVVMPVYNGEKYLKEAIESVLNQTYKNFELIITNDGSIDSTGRIINEFMRKDDRVKVIRLKKQGGISNAMNVAIKNAKGDYIVRTDGDDICSSDRFQQQVNYILSNPTTDVLGTYFCVFNDDRLKACKTVPAYIDNIKNGMPPVHHPTCLIRKEIFKKYGTYLTKYNNAEDVELWFRWFSQGVRFKNIPKVLYKKRIHSGSVSIAKIKSQEYLLLKINLIALLKYKIKFSRKGYLRVLEQALYLLYLTFGLDKIYKKNK